MAKHIVFGNLDGVEDRHAYVTGKLRTFNNPVNNLEQVAQYVVDNDTPHELALADKSADELQNQESVQKLANCFKELVAGYFQPESGEEVLEEVFTCLSEAYEDYPAGSPVIMKKTNFATIYYVDTNFKVNGNRLVPQPRYVHSLVESEPLSEEKPASIMEEIASELVDAALGDIGSTVLSLVIGDDGEPDLKQLEEDFTNIVKKALINFDVTNENAKLQTQYQTVNQSYNIKKKEGASKTELFNDAEDIEEKVRDSVNNLGSKLYAEVGLPGYIAGRNLQFCMLQEKCVQDPLVTSPLDSKYKGVLVSNVEAAIKHVQEAYDNALKNRFDQIVTGEHDIPKVGRVETQWQVYDNFNNTVVFHVDYGGKPKEIEKEKRDANIAREAYEDQIRSTLQWMLRVKAKWEELQIHPLGKDSN